MAVWTSEDIDTLKAAIGSGILSVTYAGPPQRTVTYQNLDSMRKVLAEMIRDVNGSPTYRLMQHTKGLR